MYIVIKQADESQIFSFQKDSFAKYENWCCTGVSAAGAAAINHQLGTVEITIAGNNDPHGVFQFASSSLAVDTAENANVTLQVIRKFGAFGKYDNICW